MRYVPSRHLPSPGHRAHAAGASDGGDALAGDEGVVGLLRMFITGECEDNHEGLRGAVFAAIGGGGREGAPSA